MRTAGGAAGTTAFTAGDFLTSFFLAEDLLAAGLGLVLEGVLDGVLAGFTSFLAGDLVGVLLTFWGFSDVKAGDVLVGFFVAAGDFAGAVERSK